MPAVQGASPLASPQADRWAANPLREVPPWLLAAAMLMGGLVVVGEATALAVGVALLASAFILRDFRIGVVLLILFFPISASPMLPHSIGGITGLNPINLLLLATLGSMLFSGWTRDVFVRLAPRPLIWLYVVPLVVAALIGAPQVGKIPREFLADGLVDFTGIGGYLRDVMVKPMLLVLFALLVSAAAARSPRPERFIYPLMASVAGMALMTIVYVIGSGASFSVLAEQESRTFLSPLLGLHANDLGRLYAIAYALMLFTFAETKQVGLRIALLATMALIVAALTVTFSRSAFIGFAFVNAWFILTRRNAVVLLLAALALAGVAAMLPDAVYHRLAMGWDGNLDAITAGRINGIWIPLLPEIAASPIFGNGLWSTLWAPPMPTGIMLQVTHPHNAYLQLLLDMGVAGTLLVGAYYIHVWRGFRQLAADPDASPETRGFFAGAMVGLASFLLAGIAGSSLMPCLEQIFLWMAIGLMYGRQLRQWQHSRDAA